MSTFKFYHPIQIRYGDLDPQWHVNNGKFVVYIEQARFAYLVALGLFDGHSFFDLGLIVADVHVSYLAPMKLGQEIRVGVRVSQIGNKSQKFEYQIEDTQTGQPTARAETIMVAFDYHKNQTMPVSPEWRKKIADYEGTEF